MSPNEVFVITGAAGDMGAASAARLAGQGTLLLTDVAEERLQQVAARLKADGAKAEVLACDVSDAGDTARLAERVASLGRFRALAHTAGLSPVMAEPARILEVDLGGTARVLDALSEFVEPGSCAVLIASIAGYLEPSAEIGALLDEPLSDSLLEQIEASLGHDLDSGLAYSLAKRGVMRLAERKAGEWGPRGGRVVSVSPGLMDTGMGRLELERQPVMVAMAEATPIRRPGQSLPGRADDIAAAVAFLLTDDAEFISGCDLRVDGGLIGAGRQQLGSAG